MKNVLLDYYNKPDRKFCFYTGNNNPEIGRALGVDKWDWTPETSYFDDNLFGFTHTIPLAMGCDKIYTSEGKEWIAPVIKDVSDIDKIRIPDPSEGRPGEILERMKVLLKEKPEDTLIRFPDIQSPLGVAELMWDDTFYTSLLTNPDEIHHLLDKITHFIITYVKAIHEVLGSRTNPCCFPHIWGSPEGYYIADDTNSMVSPEMHLEYSVNYINRITESVGPVYYHSCTWLPQYFDNISKIKNAKAKNWSIIVSCDPADILNEFSGKDFLTPHIHLNMHKEGHIQSLNLNLNSEYDVVKYLLDNMKDNTSMYLHFFDDLLNETEKMIKIYHLLDEYGYSPRAKGFS